MSERESKRFSPEKFPLQLSLLFAKKNAHLADEIKALVYELPKSSFRYSKRVSAYAGIFINIYLKDVDAMRPIAQGIKDKDLFIDRLEAKDTPVSYHQLIAMANDVMKDHQRGWGEVKLSYLAMMI